MIETMLKTRQPRAQPMKAIPRFMDISPGQIFVPLRLSFTLTTAANNKIKRSAESVNFRNTLLVVD
jgi:hypothetical protein